jgi:hypothetical protein
MTPPTHDEIPFDVDLLPECDEWEREAETRASWAQTHRARQERQRGYLE